MSLCHILGTPMTVSGVGPVYPIRIKDFEEFAMLQHIITDYNIKTLKLDEDINLFEFLLFTDIANGCKDNIINGITTILQLVTRNNNVIFDVQKGIFIIDQDHCLNSSNYEDFRQAVMKQNILFEPIVYPNEVMRIWAEKAKAAKAKKEKPITLEGVIRTVSVFTGKHYKDIAEYTIYQIFSDFYGVRKIKDFDFTTLLISQGAKINLSDYAEDIDMFKHPDENLFKNQENSSLLGG